MNLYGGGGGGHVPRVPSPWIRRWPVSEMEQEGWERERREDRRGRRKVGRDEEREEDGDIGVEGELEG